MTYHKCHFDLSQEERAADLAKARAQDMPPPSVEQQTARGAQAEMTRRIH